MTKMTWIAALLLTASVDAGATVLAEGEIVCRNARALEQFQAAEAQQDDATMEWLLKGAACFAVPKDTPVSRIVDGTDGNHAFRTTERRRNLTLWASQDSTRSS